MKEHLKIVEDYCRNDFYASETYQKKNQCILEIGVVMKVMR